MSRTTTILYSNNVPYYELLLSYVGDDNEIKQIYENKISQHNDKMSLFFHYYETKTVSSSCPCFDAGFDLYNPRDIIAQPYKVNMVDYQIQCAMKFHDHRNTKYDLEHYCGYYLYPRSSTGTKTHLRLANSVGIIDSGYRGNIMAAFDLNTNGSNILIPRLERYTQICTPNMSYPMIVRMVEREELGETERGSGGFGSTNK